MLKGEKLYIHSRDKTILYCVENNEVYVLDKDNWVRSSLYNVLTLQTAVECGEIMQLPRKLYAEEN